jgi:hypothetical protein
MSLTNRLNSTAVVKRKSRSADGRGGSTITYTTAIASVACRISVKSSEERLLGDKSDSTSQVKIFVLSSISVKLHDQYIVSSKTYEIRGINAPSRGSHFELDAELVRDES